MTNHIEQMMKVAGVKPYKRTYYECKGGRSSICLCPQLGVLEKWCEKECEEMQEKQEFLYPPFTSTKQLELIKLICKSRNICELSIHLVPYGAGEDFWFQKVTYFKEQKCYMDKEPVLVAASKFENVLAELTIELIKSNELDKAEVKRILEED